MYSEEKVEKNGIDIQILFDVSYSMTATDLEPNRLEVAKKVFSEFIDSLRSDRV
jgi:Ca-activated chloride channel homolog